MLSQSQRRREIAESLALDCEWESLAAMLLATAKIPRWGAFRGPDSTDPHLAP